MLILIAAIAILYYFTSESEDRCKEDKWKTNKQFLNTNLSWKNKYALNLIGELKPYEQKWYHFGIKPAYEERFPYSTTLFVFLTDGEHLFQFIRGLLVLGVITLLNPLYGLVWFVSTKAAAIFKEALTNWQ